jgi:adenylate cyclase
MIIYEIQRRKVLQVLAAYLAGSWFLVKSGEVVIPVLTLPDWSLRALVLVLVFCFPLAGLFAWLFELTPEGLRLQSDLDKENPSDAIAPSTAGRALILFSAVCLFMAGGISILTYRSTELEVNLADMGAAPNSIAVLPFVNVSSDPENEYFSDGLTEELMNSLGMIRQLHVTGRTSAFSFKNSDADLASIGLDLNVAYRPNRCRC